LPLGKGILVVVRHKVISDMCESEPTKS
jgi:hypothetical protein